MRKVIVTDPDVWPWLDGADGRFDFVFVPLTEEAKVLEELEGAWAYVGVFLDGTLAGGVGPDLKVVQITAAGTEHIAAGCLPPGTTVANAGGHGRSIAEHVLMVVLAARRQLLNVDPDLREGRWANRIADPEAAPVFQTLEGSTVGIVGFGRIGRSVARLCRAVGMNVVAVSRSARPGDPDADWVDSMSRLPDLLRLSDTVVLACPLTAETRGLIGEAELEGLGPKGILVNVARGAVVEEQALYDALLNRKIAGAAIDVWYRPISPDAASAPSSLPFGQLKNIVMTPHYSATASDTYRKRAQEVIETLSEAAEGRPVSKAIERPGSKVWHG
ncbi:2-hydroxyacid dehydrogenase [Paenarthrobacter ilicis]|uniref:2-hydroxyacid dehydrogenase n=1 Tax=Paenarthrobacter ilicis TaxID=43665 RepID=UPI0028D7B83B|nr:2-hydroxyacid dehydrogenase [Paenarthrobacter ilicis]